MWPLAALPCLSSQEIHSAPQQLQPVTLHPHPSKGPTSSLISLERFILLCFFISFLLGLSFTIVASLSLYSTSYMFVFIATHFFSLKSPPSCVSFMALGKIHPSERLLQGAVQPWPPEKHKWNFAPHAGPKHRKNFQPISDFLGQFSDPCLLLHFLCTLWRKALCPPQCRRKYDLFHLLSQCPLSKSHSSPAPLSPAQSVPQLQNFALPFFFHPPGFCDLFITEFVLPHWKNMRNGEMQGCAGKDSGWGEHHPKDPY